MTARRSPAPRLARALAAALAVLALAALSLGPAWARAITETERAALAARIAAFETAMRGRDIGPIVGVVPPRILAYLARKAGAPADAVREAMIKHVSETMAAVTFHALGMDLSAAEQKELADGTPYLLIPTDMTMEAAPLGKIQTKSSTLAMLDEGTWYLLDLNAAPQLAIFTQVYPEFAGIAFGGKTSKAVP